MSELAYPVIAFGDLHGQLGWLNRLLTRLERLPEWSAAKLVFVGDLVDRGPDVKGTVQRVIDLLAEKGGAAVMGNHDLALVQAAGLGSEPDPFWVKKYAGYDGYDDTFRSYLGEAPKSSTKNWADWLRRLRDAMPTAHRTFLADLPWVAEASGHVFLHNGLSGELDEPATVQLELLRRRKWAGYVTPLLGTETAAKLTVGYPVWLGADKRLSANPLPLPGRVQVTGHQRVQAPEVNAVRIRLDTSGGMREPLSACVLRGPTEPPLFVASSDLGDWP